MKPRVLFVAGLTPVAGGGTGGVVTASLMVRDSGLRDHLEWEPLSTTAPTMPPPPVQRRARIAARRTASFARLVRSVDAALVFSSGGTSLVEKAAMCALARGAGRGVVLRVSSGDMLEGMENHAWVRAALRVALRSAHVVVSQGPAWTRYYAEQGADGKIVEIPNGVEVPPPGSPRPGSPPDPLVLFTARMEENKGIFELLDAAERVLAARPDARFLLLGGGTHLEEVRSRVARSGFRDRIEVPGWVERREALAALGRASVYVLPTWYEGLPNSLLEAMAAGVPPVTTPVGSIPDVVEDGENGLLVPPRDAPALAAALGRLLDDPEAARRMGGAARARIEAHHTLDAMWPRYAAALGRACAEAGRADAAAAFARAVAEGTSGPVGAR